MTVKLKSLRVDAKRESEGVWIEAPDIGEGVAFKVRGLNYAPYEIARQMTMRRLGRSAKGKTLPSAEILPHVGRLLAEHILLDWRGFDDPYDADLAMQIMTDPEYRAVINRVELAAQEVGEADVQTVEDAAKN